MNRIDAHHELKVMQLLADRATEGLDHFSTRELDELIARRPHYESFALERAAAAIDLATLPTRTEALPTALRDRILTEAGRFLATTAQPRVAMSDRKEAPAKDIGAGSIRWNGRVGWSLAAAALLFAVLGWWKALTMEKPSAVSTPARYAQFVRESGDLLRAAWAGKEPGFEVVTGDVVWSNAAQHGFMRLVGLPPNDPRVCQYQLWIVDPKRDTHPIDGGVFDVRSAGEAIIAIDAKLRADDPAVFAITVEKPGGVVVSGGPLVVVASVNG